jgi:hypothetical protein
MALISLLVPSTSSFTVSVRDKAGVVPPPEVLIHFSFLPFAPQKPIDLKGLDTSI